MVLSIIQGITEFLPVSSSAHLILAPKLLGWADQGIAFDIAVHVGTLLAVCSYFRQTIALMIKDFFQFLTGYGLSANAKILWAVGFATIPVGLAGLFGNQFVEHQLRSPLIVAYTTVGFGLLLWLVDYLGQRNRDEQTLQWKDVLWIGCAQAIALIPGTSRSGITLTAGLGAGFTRQAAARFSFLLSIPVTMLAGSFEAVKLLQHAGSVQWRALGWGVFCSFASGYLCIHYFLQLLDKAGVVPFVIYRLLLGVFLLVYFS